MAGVVHRDLKPGNIMLRSDGGVALIDFGISASASLPVAGGSLISGTPYYMSPEQANGELTDERTDLYALGVMIYQMLTGDKPFGGSDASEILASHRESPVPQLPDSLAAYQPLVSRLLAKNPNDRIASARELIGFIETLQTRAKDDDYALSANSA
jgi:serine/threonine-protein kinase PpkA